MAQIRNNRRAFYVVQFIEKPFEAIDDYVCVPYSWIIVRKSTDQRVVVAYPKDEDTFDTRYRIIRKERCCDEWRFYMAKVKYESDTYKDAEIWIATRIGYGLLIEKNSKIKDEKLDEELRIAHQRYFQLIVPNVQSSENPKPRISIKRPALSEPKKQLDEKRLKTQICNNMRAFYVVQFIEKPFEGIDGYVCVPYNWIIVHRSTDQRVVVAYPKYEDPFNTRDRVKRNEEYNDEWRFYMAMFKYESDTYEDAEFWIATRNDYEPLIVEDSIINDEKLDEEMRIANQRSQPSENPRKPLPRISIKRPALSEPRKQLDEKLLKI